MATKKKAPAKKAKGKSLVNQLVAQSQNMDVEKDERVRILINENRNLVRQLAQSRAKTDIVLGEVRDIFKDKTILVSIPEAPNRDKRTTVRTEIPVFSLGD